MKKAIALSMALISSATLPLAAQADDVKTDVKQATVFTTSGILGAIAGGLVGGLCAQFLAARLRAARPHWERAQADLRAALGRAGGELQDALQASLARLP